MFAVGYSYAQYAVDQFQSVEKKQGNEILEKRSGDIYSTSVNPQPEQPLNSTTKSSKGTITIGTQGTQSGTSGISPYNYYWESRRVQFVYTKAEIDAAGGFAGDIAAIGFDVSQVNGGDLMNYEVRMAHTTATDASVHDVAVLTTVKASHTLTPGATGWRTISFDTPFAWNGTDNILVDVCWGVNAGYSSTGQVWMYNNVANQTRGITSSTANQCGISTTTPRNYKPRVQFLFNSNYSFSLVYPAGVAVNAGESYNYTVTITNDGLLTDNFTPAMVAGGSWTYGLYAMDGTTPLATPVSIASGLSSSFIVKVTVPGAAGMGVTDTKNFTVTSAEGGKAEQGFAITTTAIATVTTYPYSESFEGTWSGSPAAPAGWSIIHTTATGGSSGTDPIYWAKNTWTGAAWTISGYGTPTTPTGAQNGSSVAWFNDYNAKATQKDMLVTPLLDLSGTSNPLISFFWALSTTSSVTVKLRGSSNGGTTWADIQTLTRPGFAWTNVKITIPTEYKVATAKFGFEVTSTWGSNDVWLDNFVIREAVTPAAPTGLSFAPITQTAITLNWTDVATDELGYRIYISTDDITYTKYGSDLAVDAISGAVSGLLPGTLYYFRVVAFADLESTTLSGSQTTNAAGTITTTGSGNWSSTVEDAPWPGGVVPTSTDNVTIADGHTVTLDIGGAVCNNLTIAATGTINVTGTTGVLTVSNNLTNNGTLDLWVDASNYGKLAFTGSANATFTLNEGSVSDFDGSSATRGVQINKGTSSSSVLDFVYNGGAVTIQAATTFGPFYITNGTLTVSGAGTLAIPLFSIAAYTIPATGGVWLNNANFTVNGQNGSPTNNGRFRLTAGTYNVGTAAGNSMGGGTGAVFTFEGGTYNVTGRLNTTSAVTFNMSGGVINVSTIGNASSTTASFGLTSTSNTINISGGTINLVQRSTGATPLDYSLSGTANITGGVLNIGTDATATNFEFVIAGKTPNLVVDATTNTKSVKLYARVDVFGNVTLPASSQLNLQTYLFIIWGNVNQIGHFSNDGTVINTSATGATVFYFAGTNGRQDISGTGSIGSAVTPIAAIGVQNPVGIRFQIPAVYTTSMYLLYGAIQGSDVITLGAGGATTTTVQRGVTSNAYPAGAFDVTPLFNLGTTYNVTYSPSTTPITTSFELLPTISGTFQMTTNVDVTLDKAASVGILNFSATNTGKLITSGANLLTVTGTTTGSVVNTAGNTGYVQGPLERTLPVSLVSGSTYVFPVGKTVAQYFELVNPTTTADGPVVFKVEAFETNAGSYNSPVESLSQSRWEALITSGAANFTSTFLRVRDAGITDVDKILQSASAAGEYLPMVTTSTYSAGPPPFLTTSGTATDAASYTGYFSYGELNPCTAPVDQPTAFVTSNMTTTSFTGSFTAATSDPSHYLVVRYPSGGVVTNPVDYANYSAGNALGAGTVVASIATTSFNATGLIAGTTYDFYVYSFNNSGCAGPIYNVTSPLSAAVTTCATAVGVPGTPQVTSATSTSFVVEWTASSTPGVTYFLDAATNNTFTDFVSGFENVDMGTELTETITGLTISTTYYVRVKAVDGACHSVYSSTLTFRTPCESDDIPLTESFDGVVAPAIPDCWSVETHTTAWRTYATSPISAPNSMATFYNGTLDKDDWFFTPPLDLDMTKNYLVSFKVQAPGWSGVPEMMSVNLGAVASSASMTTELWDDNNMLYSTATQKAFVFSPASTGTFCLGWHAYSAADLDYIKVDDIQITEALNDDLAVTKVEFSKNLNYVGSVAALKATISNVGATTRTDIAVNFNVNGHDIIGNIATIDPGGSTIVTVNWTVDAPGRHTVTVTLPADDALANNTGTTQGVIAVAGNLAEGFEGTWLPTAWEAETNWIQWTATWTSQWQGTKGAACGNTLGFADVKLMTPMLEIAANQELNFYGTFGNPITGNPTTIQVMYSADKVTWTPIGSLFELTNAMTLYTVDLSAITGDYYLAFAASGAPYPGGTYSTWAVVDHVVGPKIKVFAPNAVTLTAPADEATGVNEKPTLSWTAAADGGVPTGFKIYLSDVEQDVIDLEESALIHTAAASPYTLTVPLEYETIYYWTVVATNSIGDAPAPAQRSFTVRTDPTIYVFPHTQSFDEVTFAPYGWTNIKTAGAGTGLWDRQTAGTFPTCSPYSGAAMTRFYCFNYTSGTKGELSTPPLALPDDDYRVNFWMYRDGGYTTSADVVNVYYNTTNSSTGGTLLGTVQRRIGQDPVVTENGWYNFIFDMPTGASSQNAYIIFEGVSAYGNNIFVDHIVIEQLPCAIPTGLTATDITPTTATLSWVAGEDEVLWNISVGTAGYTIGDEDEIVAEEVDVNSLLVEGFIAETDYEFYVQAICDVDFTSDWVGPFAFSTIAKYDPIVTWPTATDITFGETLAESTLQGGSAEYDSDDVPGTFSFVDDSVEPNAAGSYSADVLFTPTDLNNFNTVQDVVSVTVLKAEADILISSLSHVYDGAAKEATVETDPDGLIFTITYDGVADLPVDAGTYEVIVTIVDDNYEGTATDYLVIDKAEADIYITDLEYVYDGFAKEATVETDPDELLYTVTYDGEVDLPVDAGTYEVVVTIVDNNYQGIATDYLVIDKAEADIYITDLEYVYDGFAKEATVETDPDGLLYTVTYDGEVDLPVDAGTYEVVVTIVDDNYEGTASADLVISPAPVLVTISNLSQTYDALHKAVTVTTDPIGMSVIITYNGSEIEPVEAGSYTVVATIEDPNYVGEDTQTLVIAQAPLTLTANSFYKKQGLLYEFDGSEFAITDGELFGDDEITSATITSDGAAADAIEGDYAIDISNAVGNGVENYNITYESGILSVTEKTPLSLTGLAAANKVYDGTRNATITDWGTLTGIDSEYPDVDFDYTNAVALFRTRHVGTNKYVDVTGITLTGADADEYVMNMQTVNPVVVSPADILIGGSFTANNKVYDGTNNASIATNSLTLVSKLNNDDIVNLTSVVVKFANVNIGSGIEVYIESAALTGAQLTNYTLKLDNAPTSVATITPKPLTITGTFTALDKVYDGTSTAVLNNNNLNLSGVVVGDDVALENVQIMFGNANVGNAVPVNIFNAGLTGAQAFNYSLSFVGAPTSSASITPKELTIGGSFTANDKPYDGTTSATIAQNLLSLVGVIGGDVVTLTNVVVEFADAEVGDDILVSIVSANLGGAQLGNYTLSLVGAPTATASITQQSFTVTFVVEDEIGAAIDDAVITFNSITNVAGDYVFTNVLAGEYTYSVQSEGFITQTGIIEVDGDEEEIVVMPVAEAEIISFAFVEVAAISVDISDIVEGVATINVLVAYGTDVTSLTPSVTISYGASIDPLPVTMDFTYPVEFVVTAGDGITETTYIVSVTFEAPNDDATLADLTVDGLTVIGFDADVLVYNIELPFGTTTIPVVGAIAADANAMLVINQAAALPGSATVVVTAQDGVTELTYTVNFTLAAPSDDATLADLTVDNVTIAGFDADVLVYNIELPYGTTTIPVIGATAADVNASLAVNQATALPGSATVVVTAQDGETELTYTVNFTLTAPSTNATLSNLTVGGVTVPGFASNVFVYNIELPYGSTTIPVVGATAADANASLVVNQATALPGSATVVVTAQDGTTILTYTVNFTLTAPSTDATLSSLTVNTILVPGFAPDVLVYNIELPYGTTTIPVVAGVANNAAATMVVNQATALPGSATVVVTAQDGTTVLTYTVNFTLGQPVIITEFPWIEPFEGTAFPPDGWERINTDGGGTQWVSSTAQNHTAGGTKSAFHNYSSAGMQEGWLVTPAIEVPATDAYELSFWSYNIWPSDYFKNSVLISTDGGNEFVEVWTTNGVLTSWIQTIINLEDYAGETIYIAFLYEGNNAHGWYLDDVKIDIQPEFFTLSLVANPVAGGTVTGAGDYVEGAVVNVSAIANTGYEFVNWTDAGGLEVSALASFAYTMPAEDVTLTANFEEVITYYTLTLVAEPTEGGTVTGGGEYEAGASVTVTAEPNAEFIFQNWRMGGVVVSNTAEFVFTMPEADVTLTAYFVPTGTEFFTLTLLVNPLEAGEAFGNGEFVENEEVTVLAVANTGYIFVNWTDLSGAEVSNMASFIYTMPAEDVTLTANFEAEPQDLTFVLSWDVAPTATTPAYREEHYSVWISTTGIEPTDFTMVFEETLSQTHTGWEYQNREVVISDYAGEEIYVAIRHHDVTDMDRIVIDNVKIVMINEELEETVVFFEDFQGGVTEEVDDTWLPEGWVAIDADGDELNWYFGVRTSGEVSEGAMRSQSWESVAGALTPDNWLITAAIVLDVPVTEFTVTFNVDMTNAEGFDPANDVVYLTGSMFGWAEPGTDADNQTMAQVGESMIWTKTLILDAGTYEYKYFKNAGWDGGEWAGGANRVVTVAGDMIINNVWGIPDAADINTLSNLNVYPNPFSNFITLSNAEMVTRVVITNIIGQVVMDIPMNGSQRIIETGSLKTGVYLISFQASNGERVVRKMVKQ
jgi:uncharacterized repeat protein (TIGR02543 family)